jgi:hypothetical protein
MYLNPQEVHQVIVAFSESFIPVLFVKQQNKLPMNQNLFQNKNINGNQDLCQDFSSLVPDSFCVLKSIEIN